MPEVPQNILVINVSRIGDTLLAVPALRALATAWPAARLTALGHPKRVEVLENLPFLCGIGGVTKNRARFMGWLPGKTYDLALVYGHDEALVKYALRVAHRVVAFRQKDPAIDARLFAAVEEPPSYTEHAVDTALRLVQALGIEPKGRRLQFALTAKEKKSAADFLVGKGVWGRHPLIGLKLTSFPTKAYRDWPEGHFVELCKRLLVARPGAAFVIFGGPDEADRVACVQRELGTPAVGLVGLSLREVAGVMSLLDAYVGVDTGPTHIMGCFDIPLVGLFHCKLPRSIYGPLEHPYDYCLDHPRLEGGDETTPMGELGVDVVFPRLLEALDAGRALYGADR